jgi:hypothetical protein
LIGLLAVTGMRVGEVLRLNRDDIDWERGLLCVRHSKFDRSREIPLHHTTLDALGAYAHIRDERCPQLRSSGFFVTRSGRRPSYVTINWHFARLVSRAGLRPHSPRCRPRLHDFRHSFACTTLEQWYRVGAEVQPGNAALRVPGNEATSRFGYDFGVQIVASQVGVLECVVDVVQRSLDNTHDGGMSLCPATFRTN